MCSRVCVCVFADESVRECVRVHVLVCGLLVCTRETKFAIEILRIYESPHKGASSVSIYWQRHAHKCKIHFLGKVPNFSLEHYCAWTWTAIITIIIIKLVRRSGEQFIAYKFVMLTNVCSGGGAAAAAIVVSVWCLRTSERACARVCVRVCLSVCMCLRVSLVNARFRRFMHTHTQRAQRTHWPRARIINTFFNYSRQPSGENKWPTMNEKRKRQGHQESFTSAWGWCKGKQWCAPCTRAERMYGNTRMR